jgi:hypothetical protein
MKQSELVGKVKLAYVGRVGHTQDKKVLTFRYSMSIKSINMAHPRSFRFLLLYWMFFPTAYLVKATIHSSRPIFFNTSTSRQGPQALYVHLYPAPLRPSPLIAKACSYT